LLNISVEERQRMIDKFEFFRQQRKLARTT